jgi:hypothetical protein
MRLFLLCALISTQALAWKATTDFEQGFYWSALPVDLTVVDADSGKLQYLNQLVTRAASTWEAVVPRDLWGIGAAASGGRNIVRWSNNFARETGLDEGSVLAVTIRYSNGPYITRTEIIINGNNAINSYQQNLQTVLIHEMGHTLGLDHSEYSNAVMAASLIFNYQGLHWDDEQGMNAVVNETLRRQAIGYVSPLAKSQETESASPLSCGTVDLGSGRGGQGGGGTNMIISLSLGLVLAILLGKRPLKHKVS